MKKSKVVFFSACILFLIFPELLAISQEYGLVLSGGGGKGAYEVGVWKALSEYGIAHKITAISGTSVGGLNAALFACMSVEEAEEVWKNTVPKQLTIPSGSIRESFISQQGLQKIISSVPLKKLQINAWPQVTVTAVPNEFFNFLKRITSIAPGSSAKRFVLNNEKYVSEIQKELLATAAFPVVCAPVVLKDGKKYSDGGDEKVGGDNTPIDPIVLHNPDIHTIIIVYLNDSQRLTRRIRQIDYPSVKLIEIIPSIDLGSLLEGTVNFTSARINLLIQRGYEDTLIVLKNEGLYPVSSYWFSSGSVSSGTSSSQNTAGTMPPADSEWYNATSW